MSIYPVWGEGGVGAVQYSAASEVAQRLKSHKVCLTTVTPSLAFLSYIHLLKGPSKGFWREATTV